jgi:hypothetical protein
MDPRACCEQVIDPLGPVNVVQDEGTHNKGVGRHTEGEPLVREKIKMGWEEFRGQRSSRDTILNSKKLSMVSPELAVSMPGRGSCRTGRDHGHP